MLVTRVITGLSLLTLVVTGLYFLPTLYIKIITALVCVIAAWEMLSMSLNKYFTAVSVLGLLALGYYADINPTFALGITIAGLGFWLLNIPLIISFPLGISLYKVRILQPVYAALSFIPFWHSLTLFHAYTPGNNDNGTGPIYTILILLLVVCADSGAYFVGKFFGKRKFIPNVSPNKTWEGILGAFAAVALFLGIMSIFGLLGFKLSMLAKLFVLTTAAIIGDLVESMFKRAHSVKDSGTILPGHGGVYDRIDSLLATFTVAAFVFNLVGL